MSDLKVKIGTKDAAIDLLPNECPNCHKSIRPELIGENFIRYGVELLFKCPNHACERAFIATYEDYGGGYAYLFRHVNIGELKETSFASEVENISPSFVKIYNEAYFAEQHNLLEICGVGYRKSLEFLIKDYLISKQPSKAENIKKKFISNCIKEDVDDTKIKAVAERAIWLGNDETHYTRLWENKSIQDLKKLIDLTVHWIVSEELTKSLIDDMPSKK